MWKNIITRVQNRMEKHEGRYAIAFFICVVLIFFFRTVISGRLPIPTDTLIGLYHPFRDLYAPQYPNGIPYKNFLITDPIRQQIVWRKEVIDAFTHGHIPLWNAADFSGTPLLANIQSGALYPLNIMFFVFPFLWAWTILIMSQPFFAGVFLFLFLRHRKIHPVAALVGASCFAFSGFSLAWLTWGTILSTFMWVPLMLLAIEKIHETAGRTAWWWRLIFIFACCSSFFAGHTQLFVYGMGIVVCYAIWIFRKGDFRQPKLMHVLIPLMVALVTAPVWMRFLTWLPQTGRLTQGSEWQADGFFIPVQHLIQFVIPDFFGNPATGNYWGVWNYGEFIGYIGVFGFVLAAIGISGETFFWWILIILSLVFAVDSPISHLPYLWHIPLLSSFQPTRLIAVVDLSLSVLASYGLTAVLSGKRKKTGIAVSLIVGSVFAVLWFVVLGHGGISVENAAIARRNLVLPTLLFIGFCAIWMFRYMQVFRTKKYTVPLVSCLVIVFLMFDLFRFGWKFTPFTDEAYFFPTTSIITYLQKQDGPYRIMVTDDRILPPNVSGFYGIESIAGYDPIHSSRYEEFIAAMERGNADIKGPFGFNRIMSPKNSASPLTALLDVRFALSFEELDPSHWKKVMEEGKTKLYEKKDWTPRAYIASDITIGKTKQQVMDMLFSKAFIMGQSAVTETQIPVLSLPKSSGETVSITGYTGQNMSMEVTADVPRLLVISNMFDTHWQVSVDGKKTMIYRTNYCFIGAVIPAGKHTVTLTYK